MSFFPTPARGVSLPIRVAFKQPLQRVSQGRLSMDWLYGNGEFADVKVAEE